MIITIKAALAVATDVSSNLRDSASTKHFEQHIRPAESAGFPAIRFIARLATTAAEMKRNSVFGVPR